MAVHPESPNLPQDCIDEEQHRGFVIGAIVRIFSERDDVAAAEALVDDGGALSELIAHVVPDKSTGMKAQVLIHTGKPPALPGRLSEV